MNEDSVAARRHPFQQSFLLMYGFFDDVNGEIYCSQQLNGRKFQQQHKENDIEIYVDNHANYKKQWDWNIYDVEMKYILFAYGGH